MRRWNGWGDDTIDEAIPAPALAHLERIVGPGTRQAEVPLADVVRGVPETRLGPRLVAHPAVSADAGVRVRHARGQSLADWVALRSGRLGAVPDGVALPASDDELRGVLWAAVETGVRVIPYGGGTSATGGITPLPGDAPVLAISLARLSDLRRWDARSGLATFGAGVVGPDLEAALRARDATLGHYPQSFEQSTLGGWIATRSCGQQSIGYGRIEALFAGGHVETPAGSLDLPPHPASAAGPDLRQLVLGSEGRLGIVTEATVRAVAIPEREVFPAYFLPDWPRALEAVRELARSGLPLSMVRLSTPAETETTLALAGHERLLRELRRYLALRGAGRGRCMLLLGVTGRRRLVTATIREARQLLRAHGAVSATPAFGRQWQRGRFRTPYLRNALWDAGYAVDTLETATDWSSVPALASALAGALRPGLDDIGERVHAFTHLSHVYPSGSSIYTTYLFRIAADPDETLRRWQRLKSAASAAIVAAGGTISHQHGVGVDHAPYLAAEKGPLGMAVLEDALRRFDPDGLMNPGKLLPEARP